MLKFLSSQASWINRKEIPDEGCEGKKSVSHTQCTHCHLAHAASRHRNAQPNELRRRHCSLDMQCDIPRRENAEVIDPTSSRRNRIRDMRNDRGSRADVG